MKQFKFNVTALLLIVLFIASCSNDDSPQFNGENNTLLEVRSKLLMKNFSEKEAIDMINNQSIGKMSLDEKVEFMTKMYKSYGWEVDTDISDSERLEIFEKTDIYEFIKVMLHLYFLNNSTSISANQPLTKGTSGKFKIEGHHSSYFVTTNTEIIINYNINSDDVSVASSRITLSNPDVSWSQSSTGSTSFQNNKATVWAKGTAKYISIKRTMKMDGWMTRNSVKLPYDGKIESFRESN